MLVFVRSNEVITAYDSHVDALLKKLGFSAEVRQTLAAEKVNLEALCDLESSDFKELGILVGERPPLIRVFHNSPTTHHNSPQLLWVSCG